MNNSNAPKAKRWFRLRRLLIVLLALVAFALVLALVLPPLMLRVLNFVPRGDVQAFWNEVQQETGTAPVALPSILQTHLPPQVVALPTSSETPSAAPTAIPATPAPTQPTATQAAITPQVTVSPSETLIPTVLPSPTMTPTVTNPYAAWFSSVFEPESIRIFSKGYLDLTLSGSKAFANALWLGQDTNDLPLGIIEFDENAIPQLCALYFNHCRDPRFRIDKVDFRPNGMLVYGSLNIANLFWQQVGVVLVLDDQGLALKVAGMVWNNEVYEVPKTGPVATSLTDLSSRGNAALSTLDIYAPGYEMTIAQMYFDDSRFIVVLKNALAS